MENASYPAVEHALSSFPGVTDVKNLADEDGTDDQYVRVRIHCDEETRRTIYRRIKAEDWMLLELNVERQSMEEAFRELTEYSELKGKIDGR